MVGEGPSGKRREGSGPGRPCLGLAPPVWPWRAGDRADCEERLLMVRPLVAGTPLFPQDLGFLVPRSGPPCLTHQPRSLSAFSWVWDFGRDAQHPRASLSSSSKRRRRKTWMRRLPHGPGGEGRAESEHQRQPRRGSGHPVCRGSACVLRVSVLFPSRDEGDLSRDTPPTPARLGLPESPVSSRRLLFPENVSFTSYGFCQPRASDSRP